MIYYSELKNLSLYSVFLPMSDLNRHLTIKFLVGNINTLKH